MTGNWPGEVKFFALKKVILTMESGDPPPRVRFRAMADKSVLSSN